MIKSELLSPAGSMDALRAAVQNGADAVYFGAGDFNARRNADNFGGTLDAAVSYCHIRGARSYIALNTMVREDELGRLYKTVEEIARSGADGVIVQDLGVAEIVRKTVPTIEVHASTQLAVHNASGVRFLMDHGFDRIVLAREMSIPEIRECAKTGAELEVFVHGALCVSCSGQCLLSSMIGGRSGNRGLCAQPCRMKYESANASGYLLSTRDLCSLDQLRDIIDAGAFSLKLEGRLKRPEYVALTTRIYREAIDSIRDNTSMDIESRTRELAQMFNRGGFTTGYFNGAQESRLMYSARPNHIGTEIGTSKKDGTLSLSTDTLGSDAIVLRRGDRDIPIHPGSLNAGTASVREARKGDHLFRLVSEAQMSAERKCLEGELRRVQITAKCDLHEGLPARLEISDGANSVCVNGGIVQPARSGYTDRDRIAAQLRKTGDTPYSITELILETDGAIFLPVSEINAIRRDACELLTEKRKGGSHAFHEAQIPAPIPQSSEETKLIVQSSDPDVLKRALKTGADEAAFRPNDLRCDTLENIISMLPNAFSLVLPPVMTDTAMKTLHDFAVRHAARITGTWISNISQFNYEWPGILRGDSQLNIANNISVQQISQWGLREYTPSVELNHSQIRSLGGDRSLIVYGRLPLMELRHCPYRNTHGMKGPHNACVHCDHAAAGDRTDDMTLKDRTGAEFPLRRVAQETGCVIELLNSAPLMLLRKYSSLPTCSSWRLLIDRGEETERIVDLYRSALQGEDIRNDHLTDVFHENTTTGHYFRGVQ